MCTIEYWLEGHEFKSQAWKAADGPLSESPNPQLLTWVKQTKTMKASASHMYICIPVHT